MAETIAALMAVKEPKPWKGKVVEKIINPDLMVGVELEIENIGGRNSLQEIAGSFWTIVEDGSLRPRAVSWEFTSKPAGAGTTLNQIRELFSKLPIDPRRPELHFGDRTSVHVHTNVLNFTQDQLANVALIYPCFEAVIFQFINHHNKREDQGFCRDTNLYCIPWLGCKINRKMVDKVFNDLDGFREDGRGTGTGRNWRKYTALNFLPIGTQGTIEWRHMHGTNDMDKLTIWFNVIGAIMDFCQRKTFEEVRQTILTLNDTSAYQRFFTDVLQNSLPYSEQYRRAMSEGVIQAKLSLSGFKERKPVVTKKAAKPLFGTFDVMESAALTEAEVQEMIAERTRAEQARFEQIRTAAAALDVRQARNPIPAEVRNPIRRPV